MPTKNEDTVLIVDDNPQNLKILGNILREKGYVPVVTKSGGKVLQFLQQELPALILLDIMMPEMDGYHVCEELKDNDKTKDIPVIFLTAKTGTTDIVKGFDVGAVDYVTKPFQTAELLARVNTHIQLRHARQEINTLRGILPICCVCKKIRDDEGYWRQVESYIKKNSDADFTHGYCPDCFQKTKEKLRKMKKQKKNQQTGQ